MLQLHRNTQEIGLLHVCIDERGKFADSQFIALAAWISDVHRWTAFSMRWTECLDKHELQSLHTTDFMRPFPYQGTDYDEDRKKSILQELLGIVHDFTASAFVVALDCAAYRGLKSHQRQRLLNDPRMFAFSQSMWGLMETLDAAGWKDPVSLIIDDDEEYAIQFYKLLKRVRLSGESLRSRISAICFVDDEAYEPVQAADLLAWVAGRRLQGGGEWDRMLNAALKDRGRSLLYNEAELVRYAERSKTR